MSFQIILGVAALACAAIGAIASSFVTFEMVDRVNERLPKDRQFSPEWWYWSKGRRLWREYKRLYPDGNLLRKLRVLGLLMCACILTCACAIGLFWR